jgi:hypothetical protein
MSRIFCRANVNYLPGGSARSQVEVEIRDGRVFELPGWEECGFELVHHASSVTDWDDESQLTSIHHVEIEELAQKMTGCEVALVSAHIKRSPHAAAQHHQLSPSPSFIPTSPPPMSTTSAPPTGSPEKGRWRPWPATT